MKSSRVLFPFQIKTKAIPNCGLGDKRCTNPLMSTPLHADLQSQAEYALRFHLAVSQQQENWIGYLETFQEGKQRGWKLWQEEKSNDLITNLKAFCRRYWSRLYFLLQLRRVLITGR
jgi:hypothetical protein